jgi:DNA-binding cell septation regulator SpoVG
MRKSSAGIIVAANEDATWDIKIIGGKRGVRMALTQITQEHQRSDDIAPPINRDDSFGGSCQDRLDF